MHFNGRSMVYSNPQSIAAISCVASCLGRYLEAEVGRKGGTSDVEWGDRAMARGLGRMLGLSLFSCCLKHEMRGSDSLIA